MGMIITVGALVLLSLTKNDAKLNTIPQQEKKLGLLFAVLAPICQGIGLVMSRKAFLETESFELMPMHAAWIRMLIGALSLYAFSILTGSIKEPHRIIFTNQNKGLLPALGGAFFGPYLGMIFSMYAISRIDASVAQTIFGQVPVIVLLLAAWWQKERITWFSIFVTLLSIGGVVMMVWRNDIQKLLFPH
jgi:drug/metabolite transporter (DMT)-like permease